MSFQDFFCNEDVDGNCNNCNQCLNEVSFSTDTIISSDSNPKKKIGNRKSKVYHSLDCHYLKIMREDNKVNIDSCFKDVRGKQFMPCSKCKPDLSNTTLSMFNGEEVTSHEEA